MGGGEDEAVAGGALEPLLHPVRDHGSGADEVGHLAHRAPVGEAHEVVPGRVGVAAQADHAIPDRLQAADRAQLLVGEGIVGGLGREIEVERLGQQGEGVDGPGEPVDERGLVFGHGLRLAHRGVDGGRDPEAVRIAPRRLREGAGLRIGARPELQVGVDREDDLGPAHRERPPAPALPGLDDHRTALWRRGHGERSAGAEVPAAMVEAAHLRWIREHPAHLVEHDGVRLPRLPVREHHLHELVGAVVARVVVGDPVRPEVRGLGVVERGHHVPAGPAPGHVVEGREQARDVERLVVRGRAGGAEPEPARRRAHHREDGDRVHLHHPHAVAHRLGEVVAEAVRHREAVVEEREMELAVLQGAGDPAVVLGGHEVARGFGVTPRRGEVRAVLRLQKADHGDSAVRHPAPPPLALRRTGLYRTIADPNPA